jgi:hypothetical protein
MPVASLPPLVVPRCSDNLDRDWLVHTVVALGIAVFVGGFLIGPAMMKCMCSSKEDVARATVKKYAHEAYPQWDLHHGGCPPELLALNEYMNNKDIRDPWGEDYRMHCGGALPDGARGIAVWSLGEDGLDDTDDDIRSWQ